MDDKLDVRVSANAPHTEEPESLLKPVWFTSLCAAVADSLAPVVMIGVTRSGKTRFAAALQHAVGEQGVTVSVIERQRAAGGVVAGAHLVVFRQSQYADAAVMSDVLGKEFTPDELLSLPRLKAVIRIAGDSKSSLVDTSALYGNATSTKLDAVLTEKIARAQEPFIKDFPFTQNSADLLSGE